MHEFKAGDRVIYRPTSAPGTFVKYGMYPTEPGALAWVDFDHGIRHCYSVECLSPAPLDSPSAPAAPIASPASANEGESEASKASEVTALRREVAELKAALAILQTDHNLLVLRHANSSGPSPSRFPGLTDF